MALVRSFSFLVVSVCAVQVASVQDTNASGKTFLRRTSHHRKEDLNNVVDIKIHRNGFLTDMHRQEDESRERKQAIDWLKSIFLEDTEAARRYYTSLVRLDAWIADGLYNSALFNARDNSNKAAEQKNDSLEIENKRDVLGRPTRGDRVCVKSSHKCGKIIRDDFQSSGVIIYQVRFDTAEAEWLREDAIKMADSDWPQIIHQTWVNESLPPIFKEGQLSWKAAFPSWEYRFWNDSQMMPFIETQYPEFAEMFRMYPTKIMKVDAFRLFLLHFYGGIYADMDFFALKNFEDVLEDISDMQVVLGELNVTRAKLNSIPNAFMISKQRADLWKYMHGVLPIVLHTACLRSGHDNISRSHSYWKEMETRIDDLSKILVGTVFRDCHPEGVTGPEVLTSAIRYGSFKNESVAVLSGDTFYPIDWTSPESDWTSEVRFGAWNAPESACMKLKNEFPNSVAATIWTHSWR